MGQERGIFLLLMHSAQPSPQTSPPLRPTNPPSDQPPPQTSLPPAPFSPSPQSTHKERRPPHNHGPSARLDLHQGSPQLIHKGLEHLKAHCTAVRQQLGGGGHVIDLHECSPQLVHEGLEHLKAHRTAVTHTGGTGGEEEEGGRRGGRGGRGASFFRPRYPVVWGGGLAVAPEGGTCTQASVLPANIAPPLRPHTCSAPP